MSARWPIRAAPDARDDDGRGRLLNRARDDRIGDEAGALLDLGGVHLAHLDFGVRGVPVTEAPAPDVAIADGADILNAAGLDVFFLAADFDDLQGIDLAAGCDIT